MLRHRLCAVLLACAVVLHATPSGAQPVTDPTVWRTLLERLDPAAFVSVRLADGEQLRGTVVAVGDEAFMLQPHTRIPVAVRSLRYDAVTRLEPQKRPMSPGRKVVTGIGIGAVTYLVLVVIALSSLD